MSKVSAREFVEAWQTSTTFQQVMDKTGMKRQAVNTRSYNYRAKGVPLKKLATDRTIDWKELADFTQSLNGKDAT